MRKAVNGVVVDMTAAEIAARAAQVAVPPPPEPTRAEKFEAFVARSGMTPAEFVAELAVRQSLR